MPLLELLGFAVILYALWAKGDVTLNGKAGFFSFFFQAKDRRNRGSEGIGKAIAEKSLMPPLQKKITR